MTSLRVAPFVATTLEQLDGSGYGAALGSLGFEKRCREIPCALGKVRTRAAVPFNDRKEASYKENLQFFLDEGWEMPDLDEKDDGAEWISAWCRDVALRDEIDTIAIDVSSMSRTRIGAAIEALATLPGEVRVSVDFLYTPAEYRDLDPTDDPPVLSVEPVSGYYAGWWSDLDAPLHAIIGVGYELERASSAIDHLEPEGADVFVPVGSDCRYLESVRRANRALFETHHVEDATDYVVADPFRCFHALESAAFRLLATRRVALVPLGPKIFAVCAMMVGAMHPDSVQVIRVTARDRERAVDQCSDGSVYGIRMTAGPPLRLAGDEAADSTAQPLDERAS